LWASAGVLIGAFGTCYHNFNVALAGGIVMLAGIYLWAMEGAEGYHIHLDADGKVIEDSHAKH
jgi:cytochrome c oxidase subunit 1